MGSQTRIVCLLPTDAVQQVLRGAPGERMKTLYRLFGIEGNCLNCGFELGRVSYLIDPPTEPEEFATQNGALCAECTLQLATDGDSQMVEEEAVVRIKTV